ncbi:MAG: hypothetical protein A2Y45_02880 [Tenericutes bacterium GWC2_34_14]|nr:MAG: hypothetical protein A2Z84_03830 [Tenericutes bacterium GWA2_35_7]OHE28997.1 MAG: hypothetical protein A2Y45_02880 [Tenericutes bacterium GWC2_34_14]OHE33950.1 MAG: hypothetical protein A2012_06420 [Tenericutes bacterium GWE2_34_108]OHE35283.1 MAG: hypothetical protein A2Y46_04140 [Tenericutes bacterium GWF1_35_14]OHE38316.1 MAG: hypothetical protein A2Y44_03450 [Tenericutes bacterium GWF2_35_184]OHE42491.1 MAG: hypothetical protein A3K26_03765 [Tenericutes bacterium RIFOXYA12_FULL_35_
MKISKTKFINYIRCNRFVALDEIYRDKTKAVVSFTDDPELEDLIGIENKEKVSSLLDSMYDEDEDEEEVDLLKVDDPQMEVMLPYYSQIEILAGQIIEKKYHGDVTYSLDTYKQKRFNYEKNGFHFYCFLDGYQEDDQTIRVFEVKATTSKKFVEKEYKNDDKEKTPLFVESPEGILMLQEDIGGNVNEHYLEKIERFKQRLTKEGRYIYDISYQRYVLEHSIQTKKQVKYYLVVLNAEYVHEGKINDKNEIIYGDEIVKLIDVTSLTEKMMPIIDQDVDIVLNRLDYMNANPVELGPHCQRKDTRQCMFYPICYKHLPEKNSIFTYMQNHVGFQDESGVKHDRFELINDGIVSALDLPREWLKRENNKIQRQVMESGEPFYHVQKIRTGISSLRYPIYHLDFETFPCPLPRFKGEVPYAQSLFQFSIHIEHAPGVCDKDKDNVSYIATKHEDLREELIIKMLDVIKPDGGSIMVYNQSFEQTRLKEMANIFPKYRERLLDMVDRLFDLMHLLRGNKKLFTALGFSEDEGKLINYYHNDLNGSFSIKKVLPLFSHLTYKGMPIANGTQALVAYAKFPLMDEKTFQQTYDDLLEYCKQDTWAMVEILDQLRKI